MKSNSSSRYRFLKLALICFLILLGREPDWGTESVSLIPPVSDCLLSPENVWQVPLASAGVADFLNHVPYLLFAALSAVVLVSLVVRFSSSVDLIAILILASLSAAISPLDLLPICCLSLVCAIRDSAWLKSRSALRLTALLCVGFFAILVTLEFSLVLLFLILILWNEEDVTVRGVSRAGAIILASIVLAAGFGLAYFVHPSFFHVGLRPVSWMWMQVPTELIPRLQSPVVVRSHWFSVVTMVFAGGLLWSARSTQSKNHLTQFLILLCFALVSLASVHYFVLALSCLVLLTRPYVDKLSFQFPLRGVVACTLIGVFGFAIWQTDKLSLLAGEPAPKLVDPTQWQTGGNVILMNLDHSSDWNEGPASDQFQLVLDERWDLFGGKYHDYLAVCRDLKEVRINSYLRTDLEWGGYKLVIDDWNASILVVESQELLAIRGLSNSPHWKLMGIDGKRTIFGNQEIPANIPQLKRAVETILFLEWPKPGAEIQLDKTIVANTDHDARIVANVLCLTRLPYAGLRFIRDDHSASAEKVRTRCFLELAHRVYRHSGVGSCLDQYRALVRFRIGEKNGIWSPAELAQIEQSLEGLGVTLQEEAAVVSEEADFIEQIQLAMRAGDEQLCTSLLEKLEEPVKSYFSCLVDSPAMDVEETLTCLNRILLEEPDFPAEIAGDAWFYLGCLALETGETVSAAAAFQKSQEIAPSSAFREIRMIYLQQLGQK
ncbi:tetratricopeptide repeat protein [Thalassoglobus sp.]|uniref:tetratricopeptide repeat protein n=1 Tax=Thalassoglobus sp. TaxID=2795869 RepID=UPI003AA8EF56